MTEEKYIELPTKKSRKIAAKEIQLRADELERIGGVYYQIPELRKKGLRLMRVSYGMRKIAARYLKPRPDGEKP